MQTRRIAVLLAGLACAGHARRLQTTSESMLRNSSARQPYLEKVPDAVWVGETDRQAFAGNKQYADAARLSSAILTRDTGASPQYSNCLSQLTLLYGGCNAKGKKSWGLWPRPSSSLKQELDSPQKVEKIDSSQLAESDVQFGGPRIHQTEKLDASEVAQAARMHDSERVEQDAREIGDAAPVGAEALNDFESMVANLKHAMCDPSVMAEAAQMLNDPGILEEVKRKMDDPNFQEQANRIAEQIMADSDLMMQMLEDPIADKLSKTTGDPVAQMLLDPETSGHVSKMLAEPDLQKRTLRVAEQIATRIASRVSCLTMALLSLLDL